MAKIKIDENALRANAIALNTRISDLQALNTRLDTLILRIGDSWDGNASEAYITRITDQAAKAKQMVKILEEYKRYVETTVQKFTDLDTRAASRIRGSF